MYLDSAGTMEVTKKKTNKQVSYDVQKAVDSMVSLLEYFYSYSNTKEELDFFETKNIQYYI